MADRGWVLNLDGRVWELHGADFDTVHGKVTIELIDRAGIEAVNRAGVAKGWPPLTPGSPWIHCYLRGGPADGLHAYYDPTAYDGPPEVIEYAASDLLLVPGETPAADTPAEEPARYRRQIQPCGHGRACPYPYAHDEGRW